VDKICPENKIRAISTQPAAGTINITVPNGKFRINEIEYQTEKSVLFRLLLCREEKIRLKLPTNPQESNCPFREQYNLGVKIEKSQYACREPKDDIAHIYYRHEELQDGEQSCIVTFINMNEFDQYADIAKRFINTVGWLQIIHEKPYYRLIYILNAHIDLNSSYIKREIQNEIRKTLPSLKQEICEIVEFEKGHKKLVIDFENKQFIIDPA